MIKPGLERISRLLTHTPLPWSAIHVAGTNGKGSICAYITAMLEVFNRSQYVKSHSIPHIRHGRFTSPHLIDRWDCVSINGGPVIGDVFRAVEAQVLKRDREWKIGASEFEVLTATAFEIFNREKVDVGVVEVGMGGEGDATNVIGQPVLTDAEVEDRASPDRITRRAPLVTVISKISMDHQSFLGDSLPAIARQKAGIIKPGVPVVVDPTNAAEVMDVVEATAREKGSPFFGKKINQFTLVPAPASNQSTTEELLLTQRLDEVLARATSGPVPSHIKQNGALAFIATSLALRALGHTNNNTPTVHLDEKEYLKFRFELQEQFLAAIPATVFPGRQQWINIEPLTGRQASVLLDGAHNADSARVLGAKVDQLRRNFKEGEDVTWVLAASGSKDAREIFLPLVKASDRVVAVEFGPVDGMPWVKAMSMEKLEGAIGNVRGETKPGAGIEAVVRANDVLHALKLATAMARVQQTGEEGLLVVAGSLYLVGDVLRLLRDAGRSCTDS